MHFSSFLYVLQTSDFRSSETPPAQAVSVRRRLAKGQFVSSFSLLPPLEEQRAIITFVNAETAKLDILTAEAQRAIDLLQERRTALISAAVTGQIDVSPMSQGRDKSARCDPQRGYVPQPRVGTKCLPWERWERWEAESNPNGVVSAGWAYVSGDTTPLGLGLFGPCSQGSRSAATLGFGTESRWDSPRERITIHGPFPSSMGICPRWDSPRERISVDHPVPSPTGICPPAQGCRAAATLGNCIHEPPTPTGLCPFPGVNLCPNLSRSFIFTSFSPPKTVGLFSAIQFFAVKCTNGLAAPRANFNARRFSLAAWRTTFMSLPVWAAPFPRRTGSRKSNERRRSGSKRVIPSRRISLGRPVTGCFRSASPIGIGARLRRAAGGASQQANFSG